MPIKNCVEIVNLIVQTDVFLQQNSVFVVIAESLIGFGLYLQSPLFLLFFINFLECFFEHGLVGLPASDNETLFFAAAGETAPTL